DGDWLIDLKSTNGTIVNSTLIDRQCLQPGDVVSIGNFRLRYETTMAAASARLPSMQEPDDLSETVVMRSLKGLHTPQPAGRSRPTESPGTSSAA
ncbi:MAG: FHA domain-containing protein, partial [Gammaproteobacteria bacterium]|nr:FHA domain-containing protein [Gammaproteobacteria bacterium]